MPNYSLLKRFAQKKHKNYGNVTFIYYVHAIKKKYSEHLLISINSLL